MNMMKLIELFPDDKVCREILEEIRWPDGVQCPCGEGQHIRQNYTRGVHDCGSCGFQFSVMAGTMFHDTHLRLRKWMVAVYLMVEAKKGSSANQLKRTIGVSYKTAWYLCHRIRKAMQDAYPIPLKGIVEIDETWVGDEFKGEGKDYKGNKTVVVGAAQRDGKVILKVAPDRSRKTLHGFVNEAVADEAEASYTDDWRPYCGLADEDTRHETVNHSIGDYARCDVQTNSIENVWSLLQRSIMGSYHKVSLKHLDTYLDELEWRFNNRDNPWLFRDALQKLLVSKNLPYDSLTRAA